MGKRSRTVRVTAKKAKVDSEIWFNTKAEKPKEYREGIGKYIKPQYLQEAVAPRSRAAGEEAAPPPLAALEPPKKKAKGAYSFGNFDSW